MCVQCILYIVHAWVSIWLLLFVKIMIIDIYMHCIESSNKAFKTQIYLILIPEKNLLTKVVVTVR